MEDFTKIKECVPGILNAKENKEYNNLDTHKRQLKEEELYFRVKQGVI